MGFWRKKEVEFSDMNEVIQQRPGISINKLARLLGVPASTVMRRLPGMAEAGYLLYEDEKGKLYPFERKA